MPDDRTTSQQMSQGLTVAGVSLMIAIPATAGAVLGGVWMAKKACSWMGVTCNWMDILGWAIGVIIVTLIILGLCARIAESQRGDNLGRDIDQYLKQERDDDEAE